MVLNLRQIRDLSEYSVSSYSSFTMLLVMSAWIPFSSGFGFMYTFTALDWLASLGVGSLSVILQIVAIKAVQYEEPAKIAIVRYFQSVF